MSRIIPPYINDPKSWAENIRRYLARTLDQLGPRDANASASENGVLLWDRDNKYPVVSVDGEWRQIVVADGFAFLTRTTDVTATASNTGFPIVFDAPGAGLSSGITLGAAPNQSRIIFNEGGVYSLSFTAQVLTSSALQINFWFWPEINGVAVSSGATRASLHEITATKPVTKGAVFTVEAGDYLEAYWATDDHVRASLNAFAATAFAPASPAVSLSLTRIRA